MDPHREKDEVVANAPAAPQEAEDRRGFLAKSGIALGAAVGLAAANDAAAQDCTPARSLFGRRTQFVVMPVSAVRVNNIRSNTDVVEAQKGVSEDMIRALEEMVNAARAGTLESAAALSLGAVAW